MIDGQIEQWTRLDGASVRPSDSSAVKGRRSEILTRTERRESEEVNKANNLEDANYNHK